MGSIRSGGTNCLLLLQHGSALFDAFAMTSACRLDFAQSIVITGLSHVDTNVAVTQVNCSLYLP